MPQCFVESCGNYYEKTRANNASKTIYHMLPANPVLAAKWIKACGKRDVKSSPTHARICSNHFSEKCYRRDLQHELLGLPLRRKLKVGAIPDKNLPKPIKPKPRQIQCNLLDGQLLFTANVEPTKISLSKTEHSKRQVEDDIKPSKERHTTVIQLAKRKKTEQTNQDVVIVEPIQKTTQTQFRSSISINDGLKRPKEKRNEWELPNISPNTTKTAILKEKEDKDRSSKVNNKANKLPIRSSFRIAKKKSVECLSDSFTEKVNSKSKASGGPEKFTDKLKFMAKLQLKFERKEHFDALPTFDLRECFAELERSKGFPDNLNKMQIMEDVREGCDANPPSSPGHAEQRQGVQVKTETTNENNVVEIEKEDVDQEELIIKDEKDEDKKCQSEDKIEENSSHSTSSETQHNKRRLDSEEQPTKRLKTDIQENFLTRDKIINEFIEMAECNSSEQIQTFSEHILSEIKTLNELAKEKEREWNQLLHMKKIKEELLIRLQRKRQILHINESDLDDVQLETNGQQSLLKCNQKNLLSGTNMESLKQRSLLPKTLMDINNSLDLRQKQKPMLDVQSIIADYRQRHPEAVPRRGRRIRHSQNDGRNSIMGFSGGNFTIGQKPSLNGNNGDFGFMAGNMNGNGENAFIQDHTSYKDILVQFAKLSQTERNEFQMHLQNANRPPPPYPEVTVHPVTSTSSSPTNSLLHGILTKTPMRPNNNTTNNSTNNGSKSSFSPTLAKLLTAPEKAATSTPTLPGSLMNPGNISLSEIFSSNKSRNEITITPVGNQYDTTPTNREATAMEDELEEPSDRLVIDDSSENQNSRSKEESSDNGDDVPLCQGCNQKPSQFVCAGCGNQWYCSRDCQVAAWDDHSEVCSG